MQSFLYMEGEESPSLLFRQAKDGIKVGEPVEPSVTLSSGCSIVAPATPSLSRPPAQMLAKMPFFRKKTPFDN